MIKIETREEAYNLLFDLLDKGIKCHLYPLEVCVPPKEFEKIVEELISLSGDYTITNIGSIEENLLFGRIRYIKSKEASDNVKDKIPVGVLPKEYYLRERDLDRFKELRFAIYRYINEGLDVDVEWINEYNELAKQFKRYEITNM